ncbi:pseudouridylate synthase [Nitzschia inconspicua]|uniref:Pseudouridylate synthase n=1 Tax=Nitzschia inconspicua TaxID=303405 RepID=A0A9K3KKM5_9STRA|nr:pseudouridylate synthase [Nitzschia inconspicua]KAG7344844.1 pseudouridylate synthase [Nitzschia inconspicua]
MTGPPQHSLNDGFSQPSSVVDTKLSEIFQSSSQNTNVTPLDVLQYLVDTKIVTETIIQKSIVDIIRNNRKESDTISKTQQKPKTATNSTTTTTTTTQTTKNRTDMTSPKTATSSSSSISAADATKTASNIRTRHIALKFFYDGSHYSGLAQNVGQDSDKSVERVLFAALQKAQLVQSRDSCRYSRCGRTDRGVSAAGQVVAMYLKSAVPIDATWQQDGDDALVDTADLPTNERDSIRVWVYPRTKKKKRQQQGQEEETQKQNGRVVKDIQEYPYAKMLNNLLPPSIRILGWTPVTEDFSARFSATTRLYRYFFCARQHNLPKIQSALTLLQGTHDFRNFCKMDVEKVYNFERKILSAKVVKQQQTYPKPQQPKVDNGSHCNDDVNLDDANPQDVYYLEILGQAFLWHQIRCIAEVVFMVGRGLEDPSVVTQLLDVAQCRGKPAYPLADEKPLVLHDCRYHDLPVGYSVPNLWTLSCQLEQQWEDHTLAAARLRNCIDSLRSCTVHKGDLKDFCSAKLTERNRKRQRAGYTQAMDVFGPVHDAFLSTIYDNDNAKSVITWEESLQLLKQLNFVPDSHGLDSSSVHVPLLERSRGTTYEEKVASLKKSDKRRQKYEDNVIKKRKTTEEDAAFYEHMTKQGSTIQETKSTVESS